MSVGFYRQTPLRANEMKESEQRQAAAALESELGRPPRAVTGWPIVVELIAPRRKGTAVNAVVSPHPWEKPELLNATPRAQLSEQLENDRRSGKQAAVLQKLAEWWLNQTRDGHLRRQQDERSLRKLREIPGISWEMADRICLFALGAAIAPVGRAALRIGCRHGWGELESDREEWQHWLQQWAAAVPLDLSQLVAWIDQVGERWCGPRPKCDGCPLSAFLPPGGPREPEGSG